MLITFVRGEGADQQLDDFTATGSSGAVTVTGPACPGDCSKDDRVTVDELVKGVNIVLGTATLDQCSAFACNGNHPVTVDCLVKAVNAALNGCSGS